MTRPTTPESPTLREQLQERREQMGFRAPNIVEGQRRKSQRQDAIDRLKRSGDYERLRRGGRKSRKMKMRKTRRRLTRRR